MLDNAARNSKAFGLARGVVMGVSFFDFIASLANEKFSEMPVMSVVTSDKGIESLYAVNKSHLREKIKRAVNCRRLGTAKLRT